MDNQNGQNQGQPTKVRVINGKGTISHWNESTWNAITPKADGTRNGWRLHPEGSPAPNLSKSNANIPPELKKFSTAPEVKLTDDEKEKIMNAELEKHQINWSEKSGVTALAEFIMSNVDGQPAENEAAGHTAIRVITELQSKNEAHEGTIQKLNESLQSKAKENEELKAQIEGMKIPNPVAPMAVVDSNASAANEAQDPTEKANAKKTAGSKKDGDK